MATNSYLPGTLVRMSATFEVGTTATDPGTVAASLKDPSGALTVLTAVRDGVGLYHADFTPTLPGVHYYRFTGVQGLTAAGESAFVVLPSRVN
jgi:hypothetical protein